MKKGVCLVLAALITTVVLVGPRRVGFPPPFFFTVFWVTGLVTLIVLFVLDARQRFGNKIGIVALLLVPIYWTFLSYTHSRAVEAGYYMAGEIARARAETLSRLAAMPTLASPLHWECVFETDRATYRFRLRLMSDNFPASDVVRYEKPSGPLAEALEEISGERPVQVFLGFARFPAAKLSDPACLTQTLVQLADLRYTEPGSRRGTFALELPVDCPTSAEGGR